MAGRPRRKSSEKRWSEGFFAHYAREGNRHPSPFFMIGDVLQADNGLLCIGDAGWNNADHPHNVQADVDRRWLTGEEPDR